MRTLGIFKPAKKVYFHDDREDTAAWSYEISAVAKIFAERDWDVKLLSETDLNEGPTLPNISQDTLEYTKHYDRIFLYSGTFSKDKIGEDIIPQLRALTANLNFMLTDLRLIPLQNMFFLFDHVYTQSTRDLDIIPTSIPQSYGKVADFLAYGHVWKNLEEVLKGKNIEFYFGGTFRDREKTMMEYVMREGHVVTTKDDKRGIDTRVDRNEYMKLLDRAKFSITIADESYNIAHFITPRFAENILHDIIGFVEEDFDQDEELISKKHFLRVSSYKEMRQKMDEINIDDKLYRQLLFEQRNRITEGMINGDYVYRCLDGDGRK